MRRLLLMGGLLGFVSYLLTPAYGAAHKVGIGQICTTIQPGCSARELSGRAPAGRSIASNAGEYSFLPLTTPKPVISNVAIKSTGPSTATVTWTTDVASDSFVFFGRAEGYGESTAAFDTITPVTSHSVSITGLWTGNTYQYGVRSRGFTSGSPDATKTQWRASYSYQALTSGPGTYSMVARVEGPRHVVKGYEAYLMIPTHTQVGTGTTVTYVVSGLPNNSTLHFPDQEAGLVGIGAFNSATSTATLPFPQMTQAEIVTSRFTTPGTYIIHFHITSGTQTVDLDWPLTVDAVPNFPSGTPSSYPTIPSKALWESNMVTYGTKWCAQDGFNPRTVRPTAEPKCGTGAENCSWYYDGERIFLNIVDYTGDTRYLQCAANSEALYRDSYVLPNRGSVKPWHIFPQGLYMDWLRTGDAVSKNAIDLLAKNSQYSSMATANGSLISVDLAREAAYKIDVNRIEVDLGSMEQQPKLDRAVAYVLGHLDQWSVSQNGAWMQPFFVGLSMESLINYYEDGHQSDVRVPIAIKNMCDWLWTNAWIPSDGRETRGTGMFPYNTKRYRSYGTDQANEGASSRSEMRDLNLLIATAYAWLFKMTGDAAYQVKADAIFVAGVKHASVSQNYGKQFSQNYRSSFDFVIYRSRPRAAVPAPINPRLTSTSIAFGNVDRGIHGGTTALTLTNLVGTEQVCHDRLPSLTQLPNPRGFGGLKTRANSTDSPPDYDVAVTILNPAINFLMRLPSSPIRSNSRNGSRAKKNRDIECAGM